MYSTIKIYIVGIIYLSDNLTSNGFKGFVIYIYVVT